MRSYVPARWIAISVFILASVLNYLDRQILATMADIWRIGTEFPFTYGDYGSLLAVFSVAYAVGALFAGWFIDRVGVNRGTVAAVAVWAVASFGTGSSHSVRELLVWRAVLGLAEASAIASAAKAIAMYLLPPEQAVGQAMSQLGLTFGAGLAPKFAVFFAYSYSWHWAFYIAGILSLAWIPVWLITSRAIPPVALPNPKKAPPFFYLLRDHRLWVLIVANMLGMLVYGLWVNWAPTYLIRTQHLTPQQAAQYTWIVPVSGCLGGFLGGAISWRLIRRGHTPIAARKLACFISALFLLGTMAVPLLPGAALATLGMSLSYFWACAWSVNHYTLPIDIYGPNRAAFGASALVFAYGVIQSIISRPLAAVIENYGFVPVCFAFAILPIAGYFLVHVWIRNESNSEPAAGESQVSEKTVTAH